MRRNFRDNTQWNMFALEQRSLLDMQLDPSLEVVVRQFHLFEFAGKTGGVANLVNGRAFLVGQFSCRVGRECSREQAASQTSNAKARRLFRGENH